jgi:hypothetical protein
MIQVYAEDKEKYLYMVEITDNFKLTIQSFVTLLCGIVISVIMFIVSYKAFDIGTVLFNVAIILLSFIILAYNVNCVQLGHCYTWSWILTIFYCIIVVLFIITIISSKGTTGIMKSMKSVKSARK